jgi:hypothetical protein
MITPDQFNTATARGNAARESGNAVVSAGYSARRARVVLQFRNGLEVAFDPRQVQGLDRAKPADLRTIQISPSGTGLYFPKVDADVFVPGLLSGLFGSRKWMAAQLGASGGQSRSPRKKKAARANGKLGGRPRKEIAV